MRLARNIRKYLSAGLNITKMLKMFQHEHKKCILKMVLEPILKLNLVVYLQVVTTKLQ